MTSQAEVIVIQPDETRSIMTIGLGEFYQKGERHCCDITLPDREKPFTMYGSETLHLTILSLEFLGYNLDKLSNNGWSFYFKGGENEDPIDWSVYFMFPGWEEKLKVLHAKYMPKENKKNQD